MKKNLLENDQEVFECLKKETTLLRQVVQGEVVECPTIEENPDKLTRVPLSCLPENLPLPCPFYLKVGEKYVMFRQQGDKLTTKRIVMLEQYNVSYVYVNLIFWDFFLASLESATPPADVTAEVKIRHIRAVLIAYGEMLEKQKKRPKKEIFEKLKAYGYDMAAQLYTNEVGGIRNLTHNVDTVTYFNNHAINSAILSALIGKSTGYSLEDVKSLTYGALVHDVGNIYVPRKILYKAGRLSAEEWEVIKGHTVKGAELLQSVGSVPAVVSIALQHHERLNGKGYPRGLVGDQIHPFARIVAIADVFDAIISNRPHQLGKNAVEAIELMRDQEGLFEPGFLSRIFSKLSSKPEPPA